MRAKIVTHDISNLSDIHGIIDVIMSNDDLYKKIDLALTDNIICYDDTNFTTKLSNRLIKIVEDFTSSKIERIDIGECITNYYLSAGGYLGECNNVALFTLSNDKIVLGKY
jgi:hypothetical protein